MVKDEDEIERVAKAFALTEKIMAMIPGWLQKPMTEAELAAEIYRVEPHRRRGGCVLSGLGLLRSEDAGLSFSSHAKANQGE